MQKETERAIHVLEVAEKKRTQHAGYLFWLEKLVTKIPPADFEAYAEAQKKFASEADAKIAAIEAKKVAWKSRGEKHEAWVAGREKRKAEKEAKKAQREADAKARAEKRAAREAAKAAAAKAKPAAKPTK